MKQCWCDLLPAVPGFPQVGRTDPECFGRELAGAAVPGRGCAAGALKDLLPQNLLSHLLSSLEALGSSALDYISHVITSLHPILQPFLPSAIFQLPPCPSSHPSIHPVCIPLVCSFFLPPQHPTDCGGTDLTMGTDSQRASRAFPPPLFQVICSSWGFHEHWSSARELEFSRASLQNDFVWGLGEQGRQSEGSLL